MAGQSYTLITGASSGIGEGYARALAARGQGLILVARRVERLEALKADLSGKVPVEIIPADLNQPESCAEIFKKCECAGWKVSGLINNAGLGITKAVAETDPEKLERMVNVNIHSLTLLTRYFLPGMLARNEGFILNVGSVAGFAPLSHFAVYAASKAYVLSFSEALAMELRHTKIKVSCLCPGPVKTEFFQHTETQEHFTITSQTVAEVVATSLRSLDRGEVICVPSFSYWVMLMLAKLTPRWIVRRCAAIGLETTLKKK